MVGKMQNLECNSIEEVRENIDNIDKQTNPCNFHQQNKSSFLSSPYQKTRT